MTVDTDVGPLLLHADDEVMTPIIRASATWEAAEGAWLRRVLRPGQTVLDVGANVGYFTRLTAQAVGAGGHVVAVEPEAANLRLLRANIAAGAIADRVRVIPAAAARRRGLLALRRNATNAGDHQVHRLDGLDAQVVPAVVLDDVLGDAIVDVVKVDAQGSDHDVVAGLRRTLARSPGAQLLVEFWLDGMADRAVDAAAVLAGYRALGRPLEVLADDGASRPASDAAILAAAQASPGRFLNLVIGAVVAPPTAPAPPPAAATVADGTAAAAWIAADGEVDRGNLLGAVNVACGRRGRLLETIVEGAERADEAIAAARRSGLLVVPAVGQVMPGRGGAAALVRRARAEGWCLLLTDVGVDSSAASGDLLVHDDDEPAAPPPRAADGGTLPAAPLALRRRVSGALTEDAFQHSGFAHVGCYAASLAAAGVELGSVARVLDWGAGCGRMTSYLPAVAPRAAITAADTDAEAIGWVADSLPFDARLLPILPPTTLPSAAFDVIVGHSVLTHLSAAAQDRWLAELARVLAPGGHAAVSFNGPICLAWHVEHPLVEVPPAVLAELERDGVAFWTGDGWEQEFYDGYHTTFHSHDYVRAHWSRWFDVVAIDAGAAAPTQDIAVLRAR